VVISDSCCGGTMLCAEPLPVLPARRLPPLGAEADRKRPKADVAGHPSVFGSATDSHLDFPITERLQASATTAGTPPTSRDAVLRSRTLPMDVATATYAANSKLYDAITASVSSSTCTRGPGTALLLAACGDAQEAHEGTSHGTFTGALITTWNKGAFRGTYYDFLQAIAAQITWYQTPQYTWLYDKQDAALADQEPFTV
jgi:hypothetical protein